MMLMFGRAKVRDGDPILEPLYAHGLTERPVAGAD
jgi:hypothetical protein